MDAQQLDVIVRVAAVTLLMLLAGALISNRDRRRIAVWFTPFAICLCGFLIGNTPDPAVGLTGAVRGIAHLLSGYVPVCMWWFCLACFDRSFRPRGPILAVGLVWILIASADRGLLGGAIADRGLSWLLIAIGVAMVAHLGWRVLRDREGDLLESRRDARGLVVAILAGQLLLDMGVDVVFGFEWRPRAFAIAQNTALLASALFLLMRLLPARAETPSLGAGVIDLAAPTTAPSPETALMARLRALVEDERVWLDPDLTFDAFVRRMGASERTVRQLINHRLGHDHFRTFLNACRMDEARRLLADPRRSGDKLIAIALDSGFASVASFNRVFRAVEGCAPSAYRDALRQRREATAPTAVCRAA